MTQGDDLGVQLAQDAKASIWLTRSRCPAMADGEAGSPADGNTTVEAYRPAGRASGRSPASRIGSEMMAVLIHPSLQANCAARASAASDHQRNDAVAVGPRDRPLRQVIDLDPGCQARVHAERRMPASRWYCLP